ncbi:MAG: hypothetical protein EOO72_07585 [Myxococcaceae bacterium]|nr:MAG: hypothetical protein EOO72_07585 [Myxococcaceae bacterium]
MTATQFFIEEHKGPYAPARRDPNTVEAIKKFKKTIWWSNGGKDETSQTINQAVAAAEEVFRPALEVLPGIDPVSAAERQGVIVNNASAAKKP